MKSLFKKKWFKAIGITLLIIMMGYGLFEMARAIRITGVQSTEVWFEEDVYNRDHVSKLVKKEGEDFKILVLSDIQLESNFTKDKKSLEIVDKLAKDLNPDFITTTGDNTSWSFADVEAKQLIKAFESYNIPWSVTLGNHDSEGRADRNWHGNQYENAKNTLFKSGPSNIHGVGNYSVNIEDEAGNIIYSLIMMDSNERRNYPEGDDYDFIYYDQIKWYEWMVQGVSEAQFGEFNPEEGKVVPSMLFFHIPIPEFEEAANAWSKGEIEAATGFGENREGIYSAPVNTGLFHVAKRLGSTTHITVGHDHVNSLSVDWEGIKLTYGLKTGPTSYGDQDMQGGTLITIKDGTNEVEVEHIYVTD